MSNPLSNFRGNLVQKNSPASIANTTPPTFSGISSLTQNLDGSLQVGYSAATPVVSPAFYEIYIQANTATGLFSTVPHLTKSTSFKINNLTDGITPIIPGVTYYVGVRARDAVGMLETNTTSLNITASYADFNTIAGYVWDIAKASHVASGSFGKFVQDQLDVASSTRAPASTALDNTVWTNTKAGFVDVAISSRLATAGYTAPDNADIAAIKAKTDNLPADPASETNATNNTKSIKALVAAGL